MSRLLSGDGGVDWFVVVSDCGQRAECLGSVADNPNRPTLPPDVVGAVGNRPEDRGELLVQTELTEDDKLIDNIVDQIHDEVE